MTDSKPQKVLVVDDDTSLLTALETALAEDAVEVRTCTDAASAIEMLDAWSPDVLLLDVTLPDGTAFDVLEANRAQRPAPLVIVISGSASPAQSFRLAQLGVRTYLAKPFTADDVRQAIAKAAAEALDLRPQIRGLVGQRPLKEVQEDVRATMLDEAVAKAEGSKKGAARLLQTSRQLVQYMLRRRKGEPEDE